MNEGSRISILREQEINNRLIIYYFKGFSMKSIIKIAFVMALGLVTMVSPMNTNNEQSWFSRHYGKVITGTITVAGIAGVCYAYSKGYLAKDNLTALSRTVVESSKEAYNSCSLENVKALPTQAKDGVVAGYHATVTGLKNGWNNVLGYVTSWFKKSNAA